MWNRSGLIRHALKKLIDIDSWFKSKYDSNLMWKLNSEKSLVIQKIHALIPESPVMSKDKV